MTKKERHIALILSGIMVLGSTWMLVQHYLT